MNTAIFFADGFEEIEGLTVVDMFRRAGIPIQTVSISDSLTVTGSHDTVSYKHLTLPTILRV